MPKLYEYLGISIRLYPGDHTPIHIHARFEKNEMRVILHEKDGVVYSSELEVIKGKFTPSQQRELTNFIEEYKNAIAFAWEQCKLPNPPKFKPIIITKRIKK